MMHIAGGFTLIFFYYYFNVYAFLSRLTPTELPLILCWPNQIKTASPCLGLFIQKVDEIALQDLPVLAA